MIKAIIVDDEERARNSLARLIATYCDNIEVIGLCEDVPSAVETIKLKSPDIVFLDIEMPEYNGFELFNFIEEPAFETIFVTAYNKYALRAFEVAAIDYLLKPVDSELLQKAINKLENRVNKSLFKKQLEIAQPIFNGNEISTVALPLADGISYIDINEILYFEADGAYTTIHFETKKPILVSKRLKIFEELLANRTEFYRIHRSTIINIKKIKHYSKGNLELMLTNDTKLLIARDRKADFEEVLKNQHFTF